MNELGYVGCGCVDPYHFGWACHDQNLQPPFVAAILYVIAQPQSRTEQLDALHAEPSSWGIAPSVALGSLFPVGKKLRTRYLHELATVIREAAAIDANAVFDKDACVKRLIEQAGEIHIRAVHVGGLTARERIRAFSALRTLLAGSALDTSTS